MFNCTNGSNMIRLQRDIRKVTNTVLSKVNLRENKLSHLSWLIKVQMKKV